MNWGKRCIRSSKCGGYFDFNGSLIPGLHRFVGEQSSTFSWEQGEHITSSLKKLELTQWMKEH